MPNTELIRKLRAALRPENVLSAPSELAVYDCDAFTVARHVPSAVVFPRSTPQVAEIVRICADQGCPLVARGAGTGLAGGCTPPPDGVVVMLTRMNKILEIRLRDALAIVEPGVLNLQLTRALAGTGYHFAPDPSSQGTATIGGNVATNAGGPHTLKYGVTVNHVAGLEAVLGDGSIAQFGPSEDPAALDLARVVCGSEGTLAIVTKIWCRLTRLPQACRTIRATFSSIDDASQVVSQIIAAGIVPAALELMDRGILDAVEAAYGLGVPPEAAAVLVIELDGAEAGLDLLLEQVIGICRQWKPGEILQAKTPAERELLWKCRKMAVGSLGRLSPAYVLQDGVVPRTRLPHVFRRIGEIAAKHRVRIVNVAHAGDGNVHPILLIDERDRDLTARAEAASREVLEECIACGGSITAEHGVGIEKIALMERLFAPADLRAMHRVRQAFDPAGRLNPGKKLPKAVAADDDRSVVLDGRKRETPACGSCGCGDGGTVPSAFPTGQTIAPSDQAAVVAVIAEAYKAGTPVYASGGGTSLDYGLHATRAGIRLSMAQMNRVLDHPADDLTITVEAGATLAEINRHLATKCQWLPIDAPEPAKATIGGIVATNACGPRRFGHGTIGDYLLGFEAVDGRGEMFCGGGKVVKNAAGYNLPRLMVGSFGTLGVLTRLTFMVRPLPTCSALVICDVSSFQRAECLLASLGRSQTTPMIVELLAGPARPNCPLPEAPGTAVGRLAIGFEGIAAEVQGMANVLCDEWRALGAAGLTIIDARVDSVWNWLSESPALFQFNVLPSRLAGVVEQVSQRLPAAPLQAQAGNGVIRVYAAGDGAIGDGLGGPAQGDFANLVQEALRPIATAAGGCLTVLAKPPGVELAHDVIWGPPGPAAALMQSIRKRFDPAGILNPGRFAL
jgi:glycolate oxidase subunit GlcD